LTESHIFKYPPTKPTIHNFNDDRTNYVNFTTPINYVSSISFWAKPTSTTQSFLQLNSTATITAASGVVSVGAGFPSPTIYINGKVGGTITTDWNHIVVTGSGLSANAIKFGLVGATYYTGQLDDVRIFNYALTAQQVKNEYNGGAVRFGE